ncbi:MAG: serine/threonine-protein kinase PknK, partial [Candidatus Eisenbacteria bacterium]|nr:serine/threonine-protein kinase PknK [Candidatus Eisenbacteria bacterium]
MSRLPDKPGKPAKKRKLPQDRPRPGSETESLERVAELVAGGGDVDWARILGDSDGGLRAPLQNLLRLQRLAESCRSVMTPFVADRSDGSRDLDRHPPRPDEPDRATHETEAPGEIFRWGHLRARKKVGSGSFGDVYLAWDPTLEREVALKLRRDTRGVARGWNEHVDEARRLARIRHANVVAVYGVEEHEGRPGFWTEFVRGETLEERLERDGALPLAELVGIARNLASALSAVHDAGILHGDIKAANIVLEPSGRAVLMDFGAGASRAPKSEARSRRRAGTPLVMAPELWDGLSANVATDLFAFAVLLYRMASGRYPFEAKSHAGLERSIRSGEHVPIRELRPELPQELARLITKNLSVDPSSRSQGMAQMEAELRMAATSGLASSSTPVGEAFPTPSGGPTLSGTLTTFVGRARELDTLTRALLSHRFVTVMGPGGSGKTRLAEELVRRSAGLYPDGIIAIPLAAIGDPAG